MLGQISDMVNGNTSYMIMILVSSLAGIFLTLVVSMISRKLRFLKYLPGLILIFVGIFALLMVLNRLFVRESLDNIYISLLSLTSGISSLLFALCIGIYHRDGDLEEPDLRRKNGES
ncbi:MAG: cytochrome C biosynthesis protein [Tissierellia bacterium]|nr:cytochrome C biosynthesis protein [Tissierellia bacterium]